MYENILLNDEYWFNLEREYDEEHISREEYDDYWADYGRDELDDEF